MAADLGIGQLSVETDAKMVVQRLLMIRQWER
jgi:hypothetical protein